MILAINLKLNSIGFFKKIIIQTMGEMRVVKYYDIISLHFNGKKTKIQLEENEILKPYSLLFKIKLLSLKLE